MGTEMMDDMADRDSYIMLITFMPEMGLQKIVQSII